MVTPQYNATKAALYQRIAEIIVTNLGEVGVKCTLDEESIRNSDHEQQLRDDGAYEIYICYATQGVSFYKTPFLYMFNDDLSMWGTCDLEDFDQAYNDMLNAQGDELCGQGKRAAEDCLGGGHRHCPVLGYRLLPLPHRQIRGMDELPRLGRHQLRDLVQSASDRLSKGREQGRRRRAPLLCI